MPASNGQTVQSLDAPEHQPVVNEPSMEDILASIRRIIAADQTGGGMRNGLAAASAREPAEPQPAAAIEQVESTSNQSSVAVDEVEGDVASGQAWDGPVQANGIQGRNDAKGSALPGAVEDEEVRIPQASTPHAASDGDRPYGGGRHDAIFPRAPDWSTPGNVPDAEAAMVEPLISDSVGASVSSSFQALASTVMMQDPEMIERLTREALRPMLKTWLDENLPSMVERLVRLEIERVARGGRSRD